MADLSQLGSTAKDSIGRYFSLVSALPSAMLVSWVVLLVGSGAWSRQPDLNAALRTFGELSVGGGAGLILASLALGAILHPVQYAFVQFLEGYWGISRLARRMRFIRMKHHWKRLRDLRLESMRLADQIVNTDQIPKDAPDGDRIRTERALIELHAVRQEINRVTAAAPPNLDAIMPTRLGNVLRYYEREVGRPYGITTVTAVPFLSRTAAPGDMDYVNDQRSQLDLAVRMSIVAFIATGLTVMFLARHGLWLLVALVPYAAAYLAYRGAVVIAGEYGRALGVLVTLNRFELYDRLRLPPVLSTEEERRRNKDLMRFLEHGSVMERSLAYRAVELDQGPAPGQGDPASGVPSGDRGDPSND
ncbi:hypothetical protein GCM10023321_47070 [Pseudonocardia eucalypti]|uniref:Uncharacterized protein n=1 Tax=Pseudonocardia eucalypti TaxID=648755 RepID=A0ABP9QHX1_9PSEU|nr:hypothetical protein [Pseudonocardia eucalypti]